MASALAEISHATTTEHDDDDDDDGDGGGGVGARQPSPLGHLAGTMSGSEEDLRQEELRLEKAQQAVERLSQIAEAMQAEIDAKQEARLSRISQRESSRQRSRQRDHERLSSRPATSSSEDPWSDARPSEVSLCSELSDVREESTRDELDN